VCGKRASVGCRHRQRTSRSPLAQQFSHVLATDASAQQLAAASQHARVSYRVATAEDSGVDTASCNLVTFAQALHWFNFDVFFGEVQRVAKPDCVLVAWLYGLYQISPQVDALVNHLYNTRELWVVRIGRRAPACRKWLCGNCLSVCKNHFPAVCN
jgi:ubiquinone/menaquinone biosynthesis C-methylase UbiE